MSDTLFTLDEIPESRQSTYDPPSITYKFAAKGEFDESIVEALVLSGTVPVIFGSQGALYRQDIKLDPVGFCLYTATVPYGTQKKDTGSFNFSFDTTGGTSKVKAAKLHVTAFTPDGEDDTDIHHGAIGVTNDLKIEGTDIVVPVLKFVYTFKHPQGVVTEEFAFGLARATGKTNLNPWRAMDAGEGLFIGATGSGGTDTTAEVSYHVLASENADGDLTIGGIMGIVKSGFAYAWVEFDDTMTEDGQPSVKPKRVNIELLYDPIDFATEFGWEQ